MVKLVKPVQPENELLGIAVPPLITTVFNDVIALTSEALPNILLNVSLTAGNVILVKLVQPLNAFLPILVTPLGMVKLVKPVQFQNASSPMLVTLLGMVKLDKPVHLSKA